MVYRVNIVNHLVYASRVLFEKAAVAPGAVFANSPGVRAWGVGGGRDEKTIQKEGYAPTVMKVPAFGAAI